MKTEAIRGDWVGQVIDGRYTLLQWLGGSDASGVFLTEMLGGQSQKAAIRLVLADATDADQQIAQWRVAASLSHPHLMRLFNTGSCHIDGDRFFYAVTEYAEEKLSEILPERGLTAGETREMIGPVLDALAYLHEKGLVHGRLKPSKIMVVKDQVKLTSDEIQAAGKAGKRTRTLGIHDAPESASGTISPAADVWALGVTLVEALTQRPPVWERGRQSEPVVPESMAQPFAGIARECLRVDPARRCTVSDVRARLEGVVSPTEPSAKPADELIGAIPAKLRRPMLIGAVVFVIAVIVIVVVLSRSHQVEPSAVTVELQTVPAKVAHQTELPVSKPRASKGNAVKGEVAEQAMPEVLPKAKASIHGQVNVRVRVAVDATGNVSNAELDSAGPSKYFAKVALDAAPRWKFKPVLVNGEAVSSVWLLQFKFKQSGTQVNPIKVSP